MVQRMNRIAPQKLQILHYWADYSIFNNSPDLDWPLCHGTGTPRTHPSTNIGAPFKQYYQFKNRIIIGSDRRPETKQGIEEKIVRFRSGRVRVSDN